MTTPKRAKPRPNKPEPKKPEPSKPEPRNPESDMAETLAAVATKRRLLDAAGAIFAEFGYEGAHIRDICAKAHANVSAIKYHFGGKQQLYDASLAYWVQRQAAQSSRPPQPSTNANPEADLRAFIGIFISKLLDPTKPAWHSRMMAREMADPTQVLDAMVETTFRPTAERLRKIIRSLAEPECSRMTIERAMLSVFGQCLVYVNSRPILERVFPGHLESLDLPAIIDTIATISVAGIRAACRDRPPP